MKVSDSSFIGQILESYRMAYVDFENSKKKNIDKDIYESSGRMMGIHECLALLVGREAASHMINIESMRVDRDRVGLR